jgi:hypothetical protein
LSEFAPETFERLIAASRNLHGHMYVLPAALWVLGSPPKAFGVADVISGLEGRITDRQRVIEALTRLTAIGAVEELPREERRNAPRYFQRIASPYWTFIGPFADEFLGGEKVLVGL